MRIAFSLHAEPKGKGRPRFTRRGSTYTPPETVAYERMVRTACQDVMRRQGLSRLDGPVKLDVTVRLVPPKSMSKRRRAMMFSGETRITGSSDLDNQVKAVSDALNGVAFVDDRLIVELTGRKVAAESCGVDVIVESVSEQAGLDQGQRPRAPDIRGGSVENGAQRPAADSWIASAQLGDPQD